jgi:hypothetical protein
MLKASVIAMSAARTNGAGVKHLVRAARRSNLRIALCVLDDYNAILVLFHHIYGHARINIIFSCGTPLSISAIHSELGCGRFYKPKQS